jgi:hypothetical protein
MEPTLDQVRMELAEIHEQLLETPRDDFATRADLKERQEALRQKSHELAEGKSMHDAATLKAAFDRLHKERDRLLDKHLAMDSTSVGDAGIDSTFLNAVNKAMDEGQGIDEIEARMKAIVKQLKAQGE